MADRQESPSSSQTPKRTREPLIVRVPSSIQMMYRSIWEGLTPAQRRALKDACEWTDCPETDGIGAKGPRVQPLARLERLGLVIYAGHGKCTDDEYDDREFPIYAITDKGRATLSSSVSPEEK